MRGALKFLLVLLSVGVLTPPARAHAKCAPKPGAKTLAKNRHAIVVETRRSNSDEDESSTVWGCLRRSRRWQRIERTTSSTFHVDEIRQVQLTRTRVAYAWASGDPRRDITRGVRVYDIRARRRTTDVVPAGYWPEIARVVLAASGTVAFSVAEHDFEGDPVQPRAHRRIYTARGERATVLDDSLEIRLNTLRLREAWLTWRHGDQTRRVRLRRE